MPFRSIRDEQNREKFLITYWFGIFYLCKGSIKELTTFVVCGWEWESVVYPRLQRKICPISHILHELTEMTRLLMNTMCFTVITILHFVSHTNNFLWSLSYNYVVPQRSITQRAGEGLAMFLGTDFPTHAHSYAIQTHSYILTGNKNATPKYTTISQGYIKNSFTDDFCWFSEYKRQAQYCLYEF